MYFRFAIGKRPTLADIATKRNDITQLRQLTTIAVVDDQPFLYAESLRNHSFNVKELGDIKEVAAIAHYDVVVCDIMGVGSSLGSSYEGAHVINAIRTQFPDKYLIAYSGGQFNLNYKPFFDMCDDRLKKDSDLDDWTTTLNTAVAVLADPVKRWLRSRQVLIANGVDLIDVIDLEIAYIKAVSNESPNSLKKAFDSKSNDGNYKIVSTIGAGLGAFVSTLLASS